MNPKDKLPQSDHLTSQKLEASKTALPFHMETSDLVLCANLLLEDARRWETMMLDGSTPAPIPERAKDRRELAARMIGEVNRRDFAQATGASQ